MPVHYTLSDGKFSSFSTVLTQRIVSVIRCNFVVKMSDQLCSQ